MRTNLSVFILEVPNRTLPLNAQIDAGFDQDLDNLFSSEVEASLRSEVNDDEWAEVIHDGHDTNTTPPAVSAAPIRVVPRVQELPAIETLARPPDLLKNIMPNILTVDARSFPLMVHSSHQPSLELLAAYLKKWAKIDVNDSTKVGASS